MCVKHDGYECGVLKVAGEHERSIILYTIILFGFRWSESSQNVIKMLVFCAVRFEGGQKSESRYVPIKCYTSVSQYCVEF